MQELYEMDNDGSRIISNKENLENMLAERNDFQDAACFPLYSFLLAIGRKTVDYLSLDVESSEYKVLSTIPWDKVDIKVSCENSSGNGWINLRIFNNWHV